MPLSCEPKGLRLRASSFRAYSSSSELRAIYADQLRILSGVQGIYSPLKKDLNSSHVCFALCMRSSNGSTPASSFPVVTSSQTKSSFAHHWGVRLHTPEVVGNCTMSAGLFFCPGWPRNVHDKATEGPSETVPGMVSVVSSRQDSCAVGLRLSNMKLS